jgi:hypothetical protein
MHVVFNEGELVVWDPGKIQDRDIAALTVMAFGIGPFRIRFITHPQLCNCFKRSEREPSRKAHDASCPTHNERAHPQTLLLEDEATGKFVTSVSGWYVISAPACLQDPPPE